MIVLLLCCACCPGVGFPQLDDAQKGIVGEHSIASEFQRGSNPVRIVLPEPFDAQSVYPVIYLLPVEAKREDRFGDGITEIISQRLNAQHRAIFVEMSFSELPWYADHPTDLQIRQESYLLKSVIPFIEANYPVRKDRTGRLLLGFSKSGYGAWSLLLRNPEVFERAAAWDAPLMLDAPGKYGSGPIFGNSENFADYHLEALVQKSGGALASDPQGKPRLILTGYGNFRDEIVRMHALLMERQVHHVYRDGPRLEHHWHSGWVTESVRLLLEP
jgi:hypothetical protein